MNWETLYQQNVGKLIGVCRRYVGDSQKAEDLVHDAFIIAMQKQNSYNGNGAIEGWLYKIVVNEALQELRKVKKVEQKQVALEGKELVLNEEAMSGISVNKDGELLEMDFSEEELMEAIDQLPDHHKSVFNLYVLDGYKHNKIATMLAISPGTSKSHLARARKSVQQILIEKKKHPQKKSSSLLALLLLFRFNPSIDSIYQKKFANYQIAPQRPLNTKGFRDIPFPTEQKLSFIQKLNTPKTYMIAGASSVLVVGIFFLFINNDNESYVAPENAVLIVPRDIVEEPKSILVKENQPILANKKEIVNTVSDLPEVQKQEQIIPVETKDTTVKPTPVVIRKPIYKRKEVVLTKPAIEDSI